MTNILVLCAHPDDEVFGVGGTIAKYIKEGKKVTTIIFSYGENSMPWLKEEAVRKIRKKECLEAAKIIGTQKTIFLGLKEGHIEEADRTVIEKIEALIKKTNPEKIFTHSMDDPHIDHRAVYNLVIKILKLVDYKNEIYAFDVWNPIMFRKRNAPKLYVDIKDTFKIKLLALKKFETQKMQGRWPLTPAVIFRAMVYGFQNHSRYAERFVKITL